MGRLFEFFVYDPPTPMGRKRDRWVDSKGAVHYPEKKDVRSVYHIREAFLAAYPGETPIERNTPVKMSVKMWHKCPQSMSKKKRLAVWMKPAVITKPDSNNIVNQVFDALTGYAYVDDAQIVWISDVMQLYAIDRVGNDNQPRMMITVEAL
jgi:Holliday junction resolvase RusA-like endonuclease